MNEVGGESRARAHLCNDALQQLNRVSIYTTCGHGVQLPHKLPAAITSISIHRLTASTNRLQLQVDRAGTTVSWSSLWSTSTLPSNPPCMGRIARAQCWFAGPATAVSCSRFLRESSRFHSREFGNGKWPGFLGARETGALESTP